MKNRPPEPPRTQYLVRVHPDAHKHAERIVGNYPGIIFLRKDRTLNHVYGCDEEKPLADFNEKLTGSRVVKRG